MEFQVRQMYLQPQICSPDSYQQTKCWQSEGYESLFTFQMSVILQIPFFTGKTVWLLYNNEVDIASLENNWDL